MFNNTGNTVRALLVGVGVGAAIGIMFAPDKGSKTRKKVKKGFDGAKKDLNHKFDTVSSKFSDTFNTAKFDLETTYQDLVLDTNHKTEEIIFFLENKLSDLKKQKVKIQK